MKGRPKINWVNFTAAQTLEYHGVHSGTLDTRGEDWSMELVGVSNLAFKGKKYMKRYPKFSVQTTYYHIDQMHK